jgi:hypothetical protein
MKFTSAGARNPIEEDKLQSFSNSGTLQQLYCGKEIKIKAKPEPMCVSWVDVLTNAQINRGVVSVTAKCCIKRVQNELHYLYS